jgi:AraC-like DNA-binding protein
MSPLERKLYACNLRRRVRNRPASIQLKDLANDAGISRSWLSTFCNATYRNQHLRLLKRLDTTLTRMCESVQ